MKKLSIGEKLISIFVIALLFLQYMVVPQYATSGEGSFAEEEFPYDIAFKEIKSNGSFTCGIDIEGNIWQWGEGVDTSSGRLLKKYRLDVKFKRLEILSAGILALDEEGKLWFGNIGRGESLINDSEEQQKANFKKVEVNATFKELSATLVTAMLIDTEGNLWIYHKMSELGDGKRYCEDIPIKIESENKFVGVNIFNYSRNTIKCDYDNSVVVDENGQAWVYFPSRFDRVLEDGVWKYKLLNESKFIRIANTKNVKKATICNRSYTSFDIAIIDDNSELYIYEFDINYNYTLTDNGKYCYQYNYVEHEGFNNISNAKENTKFEQVDAYDKYIALIDDQGNLWKNCEGKFNEIEKETIDAEFVSVECDQNFSAAIDTKGNVWAWGDNNYSQLGTKSIQNVQNPLNITNTMESNTKFSKINISGNVTVALDNDGHLWTWGNEPKEELKDGSKLVPKKIMEETKFIEISSKYSHTLAIDENGNIWAWGDNSYGQLGNGTTENSDIPIQITTEKRFGKVCAGYYTSAAIDEDGNVWMWGGNNYGYTPVQITEETVFTKIDLGENYSGALDEDGNIWMWGRNNYGQLGNGTTEDSNIPVKIESDIKFSDISFSRTDAGDSGKHKALGYSVALDEQGNLYTWGKVNEDTWENGYHEITNCTKEPTLVDTNTKFSRIIVDSYGNIFGIDNNRKLIQGKNTRDSNDNFILELSTIVVGTAINPATFNEISFVYTTACGAIDSEGNLYRWGSNSNGKIGAGYPIVYWTEEPMKITDFKGLTATFKNYDGTILSKKMFRSGDSITYNGKIPEKYRNGYTCTFIGWDKELSDLTEDTEFIAQYRETKNKYTLTVNPGKTEIIGEFESSTEVTAPEGAVVTYNYNGSGQEDTTETTNFKEWRLTNIRKEEPYGSITTNNTLTTTYTYGAGNDILSAIYHEVILPTPEAREGYTFGGWYTSVACFKRTKAGDAGDSYEIKKDTTLYAKWTKNDKEELEPEYKVSSGNGHSGWIDEEGRLWMWGSNEYGQLGNGEENNDKRIPTLIQEDTKFDQVSLGDDFSGAIDEDGNLWMWGRNTYGQLGTGTTDDSVVPVNISELMDGKKFVNLSLGGYTAAAIDEDGNLYTWGSNLYGELGDGTTNDSYSPTQILQGEDICFAQVSVGKSFVSAIDEAGKIWTWGSNIYGQLGDGTTNDSTEPNPIMPEKIFKQVSLGKDTSGAIDLSGNLWMWGSNIYGQLGNGTTNDSSVPIQIMNGTKFVSIAIGNLHSVAVDEDGNLYSWGINESYQLGNETTEDSNVPIKLETSNTKFVQAEAGDTHTIAIDKDKDVWTWGDNSYYQLGYDGEGIKPTPISKRKVTFKNYDGTVLEEKWVKYGSDVTYTGTTPKKEVEGFHYRFDGWDKSLEMVITNMVYTAQFVESQVTYELTLNPGAEKYMGDVGDTQLVTAPNITVTLNYNGSEQENQEIKPQFNRWTLQNSNGGRATGSITNVITSKVTYTYGEGNDTITANYRPIVLPTPTREKYEFNGWYAHESCEEVNKVGNGGTLYTPRANVTLYAKWTRVIEKLYLTSDAYKFQINDPIEDEKTGRVIEQKSYMYRINPNTTLTELLENLNTNGEVTVYNKAGNALRPNDIVGTGMKLVDIGEDKTVTLILSVKGDPSGDGDVTATDLAVMNQQILKEFDLDDERFLSLDISDDEKITATDLAAIKQVLIGELDLTTIN